MAAKRSKRKNKFKGWCERLGKACQRPVALAYIQLHSPQYMTLWLRVSFLSYGSDDTGVLPVKEVACVHTGECRARVRAASPEPTSVVREPYPVLVRHNVNAGSDS